MVPRKSISCPPPPLATPRTWHKVVSTRASVRNHPSQRALRVEDDAIRPGGTPSVHLVRTQNRELLVRPSHVKVNVLVVVLGVRVVIAPDLDAGLVVGIALREGLVDVRLPVADAAAGVDAGLALQEGVGGQMPGESGDGEEGEEGELWRICSRLEGWGVFLVLGGGGRGGLTLNIILFCWVDRAKCFAVRRDLGGIWIWIYGTDVLKMRCCRSSSNPLHGRLSSVYIGITRNTEPLCESVQQMQRPNKNKLPMHRTIKSIQPASQSRKRVDRDKLTMPITAREACI